MGVSDTINWYGRTFPKLDRSGEDEAFKKEDPKTDLVLHSVFYVIRGLVLSGKKITAGTLSCVIGQMYDDAEKWIASDRSRLCCEFLLGTISDGFLRITRDNLLVNSPLFKSLDAPVSSRGRSHGGEASTLLEIIADTYAGTPGTSLDANIRESTVKDDDVRRTDGLVYDSVLDAYIRPDLVKDRAEHVKVERRTVENGIFSFSDEVQRNEERRQEMFSPIRSSRICDRIVSQTKAKRKRYRKTFRGNFWTAPKPGESASVIPLASSVGTDSRKPLFDFTINRVYIHNLPYKCLACVLLDACSSWICGRAFCRGIHCPYSCRGPFIGDDFRK